MAVFISAAFPVVSYAAAGRVEFAVGNVTAAGADGRERPLAKGAEINSGDTIQTADGRTQIKFTDGGYMSLQPNTQFKVDDYAYEGKADGSEKGFFKLVKGSLRAITGAIGHTNKATYRINTPVATIGIRGTELTGEYTETGDQKKLKVHVSHGSVYLENEGGTLLLFQGQSGIVTNEGASPGYSDDGPIVGAEGPDGGKPKEGQEDEGVLGIFTAAEQYDDTGVPVAIFDPVAAVIAQYAAANAEGTYFLDYNGSVTGIPNTNSASGASGYTAELYDGRLEANFGSYSLQAFLYFTVSDGESTGWIYFENIPGTITGSGLKLAGINNFSSGPSCASGGCSINAAGLFSGSAAQDAAIGYTIKNFINPGGTVNGIAGFHSSNVPCSGSSCSTPY